MRSIGAGNPKSSLGIALAQWNSAASPVPRSFDRRLGGCGTWQAGGYRRYRNISAGAVGCAEGGWGAEGSDARVAKWDMVGETERLQQGGTRPREPSPSPFVSDGFPAPMKFLRTREVLRRIGRRPFENRPNQLLWRRVIVSYPLAVNYRTGGGFTTHCNNILKHSASCSSAGIVISPDAPISRHCLTVSSAFPRSSDGA
jgi:hypothetical protein